MERGQTPVKVWFGIKSFARTFDIVLLSILTAMNKAFNRVFLSTCGALPTDRIVFQQKGYEIDLAFSCPEK